MTEINNVGKITMDKAGRFGARVLLQFREADGFDGVYTFNTHGLTLEQVAQERDRIRAHHSKKSERMIRFMEPEFRRVRAGYELRDCIIRERGTDVEILVRLQRQSDGMRIQFTVIRPTIDDLPSDAEIEDLFNLAINDNDEKEQQVQPLHTAIASTLAVEKSIIKPRR